MAFRTSVFNAADVAVVGAGPAGLMAAISAAEEGAQVVIFEQLDRPAAKLAVTGGGRCNLTNNLPPDEFMARFGREGRFMQPALAAFDAAALISFMAGLGIPTACPDGVHIFPKSSSAEDVRQALLRRLNQLLGVTLRVGARVTGLRLDDSHIVGLTTDAGRQTVPRVILATGGKSWPSLGATGIGYALAAQAGHAIVDPIPALVPLAVREPWVAELAGVSLHPARLTIDLPGQSREGITGDVLFTHTGLSGPAVLDLSGDVASLLAREGSVPVRLCLTPETSADEWIERMGAWQDAGERKAVHNLVAQHLPESVARVLARLVETPADATISQVSSEKRRALAEAITAMRLTVSGTEGFAKSMATRGGVRLKDVDPQTLESRFVHGLYFAGELLNLDGPCGGYNLQWAFSSGHLAGLSAGRAVDVVAGDPTCGSA